MRTRKAGRCPPPTILNHYPHRCLTPPASRLMDECPESPLRANEQRHCRMRGVSSFARTITSLDMSVIALAKVWIIPPGPCDMRGDRGGHSDLLQQDGQDRRNRLGTSSTSPATSRQLPPSFPELGCNSQCPPLSPNVPLRLPCAAGTRYLEGWFGQVSPDPPVLCDRRSPSPRPAARHLETHGPSPNETPNGGV
jgi:hypothetical protein